MEFKKGDGATHYFRIPEGSYNPGDTLFFAAKEVPDDDNTDAAAVINKSFNDSNIVNSSHEQYAAGYVTWQLDFVASDTSAVSFSDNSEKKEFKGEFQLVPAVGEPSSFPADDQYIEVIVYADIKRGTS